MKTFQTPKTANRRARRRGAELLEFAIVVPFLLLLTMGMVQYGLISNASSVVTNLTREGARFGALHGAETTTDLDGTSYPTDTAIKKYIQKVAANTTIGAQGVPDSAISISPPAGDAARLSGQPITVSITYDMSKKLFLPAGFMPQAGGLPNGRFGPYTTTSVMIIE